MNVGPAPSSQSYLKIAHIIMTDDFIAGHIEPAVILRQFIIAVFGDFHADAFGDFTLGHVKNVCGFFY